MRILLVLLLLFVLSESRAHAADDWFDSCRKSLESPIRLISSECRKSFARDIYKKYFFASKLVPKLSPKEIEWIEDQTSDMGNAGYIRAVKSTEYAIYKIQIFTQQPAIGAKLIAENDLGLAHELYIWAQIFPILKDFEGYYLDNLIVNKYIDPAKFTNALGMSTCGKDSNEFTYGKCIEFSVHAKSTMILQRMVIPGLEMLMRKEAEVNNKINK